MRLAPGVSADGELGCLGLLETGHGFEGKLDRSSPLTDPDESQRFVLATKVDAQAVAIGTSHGAYKFTRKPTSDVLAMDVIEKIHANLPNTRIVLHGSSSVLEEYPALFNEDGGEDARDLWSASGRDRARHQVYPSGEGARAGCRYRQRSVGRRRWRCYSTS
jgi:fructose-bisphosphate aldolase class II